MLKNCGFQFLQKQGTVLETLLGFPRLPGDERSELRSIQDRQLFFYATTVIHSSSSVNAPMALLRPCSFTMASFPCSIDDTQGPFVYSNVWP